MDIAGMHIDAATVVFGAFALGPTIYLFIWLPIKATRMHFRSTGGKCPSCGRPLVKRSTRQVDQMYGSQVERLTCPKGHVYVSGDRHFAEW